MVKIEATDFLKGIKATNVIKKMKEYPVGDWLLGLTFLVGSITAALAINEEPYSLASIPLNLLSTVQAVL